MAEADPQIIQADTSAPALPKPRARWLRPALMLSLPLVLLAIGAWFWATSGRFVSTDNAYVQQDKVAVSAEVGGRIVEVAVRENQHVERGQLLFRIDSDPYRIAVEQAKAGIAGAQVQLATLQSSYRGTGADIQGARDAVRNAEEDHERQRALMARGFTTRAQLQDAEHSLQQARVRLQNALAEADEARARLTTGSAVPGVNPQIAQSRAQLHQAELNLARTEVRAPVAGRIAQSERLQVGQMMVSGLPALSVVANGRSWIEANFKETDLANMRVGQPATIEFDAYPGVELKGHVESIGAGTGSEFSVLPAQNANGNWVKVTQRVPVRIAIDGPSPRPLIAGLSAEVTVDVRGRNR